MGKGLLLSFCPFSNKYTKGNAIAPSVSLYALFMSNIILLNTPLCLVLNFFTHSPLFFNLDSTFCGVLPKLDGLLYGVLPTVAVPLNLGFNASSLAVKYF